jgi:hypothetical protein
MRPGRCIRATYDNTRNAVLGIAVALQVLRDCNEDTGRKSHVEYPVVLLAALLDLLHVLLKCDEGVILVVLARNVRAEFAELVQLLLQFLCRGLNVRLDALEVLLTVHLRACISDDVDVLWEKVVSVLYWWSEVECESLSCNLRGRKALGTGMTLV